MDRDDERGCANKANQLLMNTSDCCSTVNLTLRCINPNKSFHPKPFITLSNDKIETITDVPLLPLLVEADRAWTVWRSKPITAWCRLCSKTGDDDDPAVERYSTETLAQKSTAMKIQVCTERWFTTTGLLIASFMYIFLFVSAALYIPLPGAYGGSNLLSVLDSHTHIFARRSLRGQSVYTNTTDTFKNVTAFDFPQRPTVQIFSAIPNVANSHETRPEEVAGVPAPAPAIADYEEELTTEDASSAAVDDDSELEIYALSKSSFNDKISKTRAKSKRQNTPGLYIAIHLGLVSYIVIAGFIIMSFR